ncbi:LbtU family siderophore porin [Legionella sp. CNM-4043-24]|uniref:LbtU family siderophore porin n=1 Tax=Legionella sp. CNM-4043-24 TaxID=3421646 RepID=UPI00403A8A92
MKHTALILALAAVSIPSFAADNEELQQQIIRLQKQSLEMQKQLEQLQKQLISQRKVEKLPVKAPRVAKNTTAPKPTKRRERQQVQLVKPPAQTYHDSTLYIHRPNNQADPHSFFPSALIADGRVVTYIAGTPVVTSPYTGDRPAFDGSDYIVNISSINRDIRLMEQRRRLYHAYEQIGYPIPNIPIVAISGKSEPVISTSRSYAGNSSSDLTLGSSELDVAAALNRYVEAFMSIAYDESPPVLNAQRVSNSSFDLNLGFVNIGNLDVTPIYFTAGQVYAPFGRYSSAMISSPITLTLARTKTRPAILGYKSQGPSGPYAAAYGFTSDTTLGGSGVGGVNLGYIFSGHDVSGDIGVGYIGSMNDAQGMQITGSAPYTTFGGFASITNGSEAVAKTPGLDIHGNISFDRYSLTAEWVGASRAFRTQDLSFNGRGAKPQAAQLEAGVTFITFDKPASLGFGYQWSKETLALNLPKKRISGVFNISIWKDTVESLEYRHDIDFSANTFANGAAPVNVVNANTIGTGKSADTLIAQIGVYF